MRIYLSDLGHNQVTVSSDTYPLGIANLATFLGAQPWNRESHEIRIFREPESLKAALDSAEPDILGVSSYAWNHNLSLAFARYAKARYPGVLTLMGGPNYPLTFLEQETFLRGMPEIDVAVRGPTYEGERAFANLVRRYQQVGKSLEGLQEEPLPGNAWIHATTKEFVPATDVERIRDLDEIPSPYLAGILDPFIPTGYFPLLQITRGCPFTCTFCNSSVRSNAKAFQHSFESVRSDLFYLAERVKPEIPLCFADDNFGMYPVDMEVADYIAYLQDRFDWPRYIRTTTGKNRADRIASVMKKVRGALPMTAAVQSMTPTVLENIQRSNIKLETYAQVQKELLAMGMQSYGELILCLPGESKETFMKGVSDLLATGVKRISAHQLMLLHGAPLSNPENRKRFGFKTRFRVVARNVGIYAGDPVVEVEEIVVETPDFSFTDYLDTRVFHLLLTIFYYEGNVEEAFEFAGAHGIKPEQLIGLMQTMLDQAPPGFKRVIDDFVRESEDELFDTAGACQSWAVDHIQELISGKVGGNLLSKYSMLARFFETGASLDLLEAGILESMVEPSFESIRALQSVICYLRCVLLHSPFAESTATMPVWKTEFDVESWWKEGCTKPLESYAFESPRVFRTTIRSERKALILSRLGTFGDSPSGLGKFTRTMFARDLRREIIVTASEREGQSWRA